MTKERRYPETWDEWPSVTEILADFPAPGLVRWLRHRDATDIKQASEKGLNIGALLHDMRIKIEKGEPFEIVTQHHDEARKCLASYFEWKRDRGPVRLVASEKKMCSEELGYKGTSDDVFDDNGRLIMVEYKTNKAIYDEHMEQCVAYKHLWESYVWMPISECWVVRFSKEKPEYETKLLSIQDERELWESFRNKLMIFNIRKRRKERWDQGSR